MAYDHNDFVYVGPFIECKKKTVVRLLELAGCPDCRKKRKGNFCSSCGGKVGTFLVSSTKIVSPPGVEERVIGRLILVAEGEPPKKGDPDRFVPDCRETDGRVLYFHENTTAVEIDREADLVWFWEHYRDDVQVLGEEYGHENVRVVHGVCTWDY